MSTDVKIHCRVPIGLYCHVHDKPDPSNTNTPRTTGAIALHAQGNVQGGYNFLNLTTWKVIQRRSCTELPTPSHIIPQVEEYARKELKFFDTDDLPDQTEFCRRDKSVIEDDPQDVNPNNQDEGADNAADTSSHNSNNSDSESEDNDDAHAHDTGAPPPNEIMTMLMHMMQERIHCHLKTMERRHHHLKSKTI